MVALAAVFCSTLLPALLAVLPSSFVSAVDGDGASSCRQRGSPVLDEICNAPHGGDGPRDGAASVLESIGRLIPAGNLSKAREVAYACLAAIQDSKNGHESKHTDCCPSSREEVIKAYKSLADDFFSNDDFLRRVEQSHLQQRGAEPKPSSYAPPACWDGQGGDSTYEVSVGADSFSNFGDIASGYTMMSRGSAAIEQWNDCCSFFRPCNAGASCFDKSSNGELHLCCDISAGLDNHLILPALREPYVNVRLEFADGTSGLVEVEQEGSLRMFDVAGVLWPAGYLLGLCLANPIQCGVPEVLDAMKPLINSGQALAVELGAGVGFPSIALAKALHNTEGTCTSADVCDQPKIAPMVLATDTSHASLAMIASNAHKNGVGKFVAAFKANHTDADSLSSLIGQVSLSNEAKDGFDVVFGSSLQALFDDTSQKSAALWRSLDALVSQNNPNAVVLLSHVRTGSDRISLPPDHEQQFECIRRVSGDQFDMRTRDGGTSDFEIVLLRRRR